MTALAPTVEVFFTQQLAFQRDASPHTVATDRETLRLCWSSSATAAAHRPPGSTPATAGTSTASARSNRAARSRAVTHARMDGRV